MTNDLAQSIIATANQRNVYFLWSGGNDSNFLLRTILKYDINSVCKLKVVTIPFPQHVYSPEKMRDNVNFFADLNIDFQALNTEEQINDSVPYSKACLFCKTIRRARFLEYYEPLQKKDDLIITGHNLSDLMSYYAELCIFQLDKTSVSREERFLEVTNKFLRIYRTEFETDIFRPLIDMSNVSIQRQLDCVTEEDSIEITTQKCYWADQRKRLLQEYFTKANILSDFETVKRLLEVNFSMPSIEEFRKLPFDTYLV